MNDPGLNEFFKLAFSAFAGIFVGVLVQLWKSLRDERRILCDEFCKVALEAADAASQYWKGGAAASEYEAARLLAYQKRLEGYRVMTVPCFTPDGALGVQSATVDLFDAITGGEFRSKTKPADERRSAAAQTAAAELVIAVRRGFIGGVRPGAVVNRSVSNQVRKFSNSRLGKPISSELRTYRDMFDWRPHRKS